MSPLPIPISFTKPKPTSSPVVIVNNFYVLTQFCLCRILGRAHGSAPIERMQGREKRKSKVEVKDESDEETDALEETEGQSKGA